MRQTGFAAVILVFAVATVTSAQHDPQRDASRLVADGKLDQASKVLAKADAKAAETRFLRMLISVQQGNLESALQEARAALDAGLPFGRLVAGPRELLKPIYQSTEFKQWAAQHPDLRLLHGPMLGDITDSSVRVWLRTAQAAKVQVKAQELTSGDSVTSAVVSTTAATDFATTLQLNGLRPQATYKYQVLIDGKQQEVANATFKTSPRQFAAARFAVAFGGGAGYIPKWEYMWDTIRKVQPHALLMLGDNVYIDAPKQTLTARYCYYRRQSRPEWRRLVATTPTYSIYDDHDFGTNDCVPGPEIEKPAWKRAVWERFKNNWCNPGYGGGPQQPGCWYDFYIGDVHFIMLDGRYYRNRQAPRSMLGAVQKEWLFKTLKNSRGTFKVLASPVPWTVGIKPGSKDPWDGFPQEREEIFSFIESHKIDGLFLIAADRHRTDLRISKRQAGYDLFEFESSRLTNRHTHKVVKTDGLIWGYNKTCSFGLMKFDTTADDPRVVFQAHTIDGDVVHEHTLKLSQLKQPR